MDRLADSSLGIDPKIDLRQIDDDPIRIRQAESCRFDGVGEFEREFRQLGTVFEMCIGRHGPLPSFAIGGRCRFVEGRSPHAERLANGVARGPEETESGNQRRRSQAEAPASQASLPSVLLY